MTQKIGIYPSADGKYTIKDEETGVTHTFLGFFDALAFVRGGQGGGRTILLTFHDNAGRMTYVEWVYPPPVRAYAPDKAPAAVSR